MGWMRPARQREKFSGGALWVSLPHSRPCTALGKDTGREVTLLPLDASGFGVGVIERPSEVSQEKHPFGDVLRSEPCSLQRFRKTQKKKNPLPQNCCFTYSARTHARRGKQQRTRGGVPQSPVSGCPLVSTHVHDPLSNQKPFLKVAARSCLYVLSTFLRK